MDSWQVYKKNIFKRAWIFVLPLFPPSYISKTAVNFQKTLADPIEISYACNFSYLFIHSKQQKESW